MSEVFLNVNKNKYWRWLRRKVKKTLKESFSPVKHNSERRKFGKIAGGAVIGPILGGGTSAETIAKTVLAEVGKTVSGTVLSGVPEKAIITIAKNWKEMMEGLSTIDTFGEQAAGGVNSIREFLENPSSFDLEGAGTVLQDMYETGGQTGLNLPEGIKIKDVTGDLLKRIREHIGDDEDGVWWGADDDLETLKERLDWIKKYTGLDDESDLGELREVFGKKVDDVVKSIINRPEVEMLSDEAKRDLYGSAGRALSKNGWDNELLEEISAKETELYKKVAEGRKQKKEEDINNLETRRDIFCNVKKSVQYPHSLVLTLKTGYTSEIQELKKVHILHLVQKIHPSFGVKDFEIVDKNQDNPHSITVRFLDKNLDKAVRKRIEKRDNKHDQSKGEEYVIKIPNRQIL